MANTNQAHAQAVQGQAETPAEPTPDMAQGRVNAVEDFKNLSEESNLDKQKDARQNPQAQNDEEQIINLLG